MGPLKTTRYENRIVYSFSGMRGNGMRSMWTLAFYYDTRKWRTKHVRTEDDGRLAQLPGLQRAESKSGRVTDMLRAKLKPEHIAEATRLALEYQRRHGR